MKNYKKLNASKLHESNRREKSFFVSESSITIKNIKEQVMMFYNAKINQNKRKTISASQYEKENVIFTPEIAMEGV